MDKINPAVFDTPLCDSDLDHEKWRQIYQWRRGAWRACAKSGYGKLCVFNMPRRFGSTTMAHRAAADGFPPGTKVTLIVKSERQKKTYGNYECVVGFDIPFDTEVAIFDYYGVPAAHCTALRDAGLTVIVFGCDVGSKFEGYADKVFSFLLKSELAEH